MSSCRWLGVFALAWCLTWAAGQKNPTRSANGGVTESAAGVKVSHVEDGVMSATTPFGEKFKREDVREATTAVVDLLKGSTSTNKRRRQPLGWFSHSVTGTEQTFSRSQVPASGTSPVAMAQSAHSPATKNALPPPNSRQTPTAKLQLSLSGWAGLPFSISKMTAELSLSFAETNASFMFPSTAKSNIPKSQFFLKPTKSSPSPSTSPNIKSTTGQTSISATIPAMASLDTLLPRPPANLTTALVHSSRPRPTTAVSYSTATSAATASTLIPSASLSSQPPGGESTPHPSTGSPPITPFPQFSTHPTSE